MKGQVPAVKKMARLGGVLVAAAAALAGVGVMPAAADGPGSTTIATGPTVGADLMMLPDGNWSVVMGATGFPAGEHVALVVRSASFEDWRTFRTTSAPSTYCPGYAPCVVYPAGSIVPPATIRLEVTDFVDGVRTTTGQAHCGDSLTVYGTGQDSVVTSPTVTLTVPACTPGGIGGGSGGGRPPKPLPV